MSTYGIECDSQKSSNIILLQVSEVQGKKPEWSYPENLEFLDLCSLQIIKMNHTNKNILTASAKVRWLQWHL